MLTLDQKLLLDRLDAYIDYCESQRYTKANYSTYFLSYKEQRTFDECARANAVYNINLPILGNTYKHLNLICNRIKPNNLLEHESISLDSVVECLP